MEALNDIYPARFFARRDKLHWRAPILCGAIQRILKPTSVVDVGCATGDLVKGFIELGIEATGLEGSEAVAPYLVCDAKDILLHDLRRPIEDTRGWLDTFIFSKDRHKKMNPYSLVTCFEVAEHIEPEFADVFLDNLCFFSNRILMSAAGPGQGGVHHVNCQPFEYWRDKMAARGYAMNENVYAQLRKELFPWAHKPGVKAIFYNMIYFEKERTHA